MAAEESWTPITSEEFHRILKEEVDALPERIRNVYEQFHYADDCALLLRSEMYGPEKVFVAARSPDGVIYYDDVEAGFDFSPVDENGKIMQPGGANRYLVECVEKYLTPRMNS